MNRKYFYVILGFTFLCLLLILIFFIGNDTGSDPKNNVQTDSPPFARYISATGIVEPESGNIKITSSFNRVINKINVCLNDHVRQGEVLFELDNKDLLADLKIKENEYEKSIANLNELKAMPRKEDLAMAKESLKRAQAEYNAAKSQYEMVVGLPTPHSISQEEQNKRLYNYQQAEARLKEAEAQLNKVKAGTWKPKIEIAQSEVEEAKAEIGAIESKIEQTYIKSPINGTVLQVNIHEGETLDPNKTALILGDINELNLRVSIDQFNAAHFKPNAKAVAFRQGDLSTRFPLKFIHMEQVMVPKKYLTNDISEKVDTLVFEILYRIEKKDSLLFIGEQMDVYINVEKK